MKPQDYINRAQASLRDNNTIGALTILEEGYAKFRSPELLTMIEQARSYLNHLKDRKNYLDFYERQQRKPDKYYSFGRRLERRIRRLFGAKTKRLVENCAKNPRYIKAETDIRGGGIAIFSISDVGKATFPLASVLVTLPSRSRVSRSPQRTSRSRAS